MLTKRRRSEVSGSRPVMSLRQEKDGRSPRRTASSAPAMAAIAGFMSSSVVFPSRRPSVDCEMAPSTPRKLGSAASVPRNGSALMSWAVSRLTSSTERNSTPLRAKKGPPSGRVTVRMRSVRD